MRFSTCIAGMALGCAALALPNAMMAQSCSQGTADLNGQQVNTETYDDGEGNEVINYESTGPNRDVFQSETYDAVGNYTKVVYSVDIGMVGGGWQQEKHYFVSAGDGTDSHTSYSPDTDSNTGTDNSKTSWSNGC